MQRSFFRSLSAQQIIHIHPQAAAKPPVGAACNGCGLCCLAETCPVGIVLSRSRNGPCKALQWVESQGQYRCAALGAVPPLPIGAGVRPWRWLLLRWGRLQARIVGRWIAAGSGCDCDLEAAPGVTIEAPGPSICDARHD